VTTFKDEPPQLDHVSAYDEAHLASYIRLLDAEAEGADWRENRRDHFWTRSK